MSVFDKFNTLLRGSEISNQFLRRNLVSCTSICKWSLNKSFLQSSEIENLNFEINSEGTMHSFVLETIPAIDDVSPRAIKH